MNCCSNCVTPLSRFLLNSFLFSLLGCVGFAQPYPQYFGWYAQQGEAWVELQPGEQVLASPPSVILQFTQQILQRPMSCPLQQRDSAERISLRARPVNGHPLMVEWVPRQALSPGRYQLNEIFLHIDPTAHRQSLLQAIRAADQTSIPALRELLRSFPGDDANQQIAELTASFEAAVQASKSAANWEVAEQWAIKLHELTRNPVMLVDVLIAQAREAAKQEDWPLARSRAERALRYAQHSPAARAMHQDAVFTIEAQRAYNAEAAENWSIAAEASQRALQLIPTDTNLRELNRTARCGHLMQQASAATKKANWDQAYRLLRQAADIPGQNDEAQIRLRRLQAHLRLHPGYFGAALEIVRTSADRMQEAQAASLLSDRRVLVFQAPSGQEQWRRSSPHSHASLSPSALHIAVVTGRRLLVYDVSDPATARHIHPLPQTGGLIRALNWRDDETIAVTFRDRSDQIILMDRVSGDRRLTVSGAWRNLAFSANGRWFAAWTSEQIRIVDAHSGEDLATKPAPAGLAAVSFHPAGGLVVTAGDLQSLWRVPDATPEQPPMQQICPAALPQGVPFCGIQRAYYDQSGSLIAIREPSDLQMTQDFARSQSVVQTGQHLAAPAGSPVYPATPGTVAGVHFDSVFGHAITIQHAAETPWFSLYAGLQAAPTRLPGQHVASDTVIGYAGPGLPGQTSGLYVEFRHFEALRPPALESSWLPVDHPQRHRLQSLWAPPTVVPVPKSD